MSLYVCVDRFFWLGTVLRGALSYLCIVARLWNRLLLWGGFFFFLVFESMQLNVNVLKIIVKSNQSGDVFRSLYGILFFVLSTLINRRKVFEESKSIEWCFEMEMFAIIIIFAFNVGSHLLCLIKSLLINTGKAFEYLKSVEWWNEIGMFIHIIISTFTFNMESYTLCVMFRFLWEFF